MVYRSRLGNVLIAVVDGLKGFPDAIEVVFPHATVQTCLMHLIRRSPAYVSYKERRALAAALKTMVPAWAAQTRNSDTSKMPGRTQHLHTGRLPPALAATPPPSLPSPPPRTPPQGGRAPSPRHAARVAQRGRSAIAVQRADRGPPP